VFAQDSTWQVTHIIVVGMSKGNFAAAGSLDMASLPIFIELSHTLDSSSPCADTFNGPSRHDSQS